MPTVTFTLGGDATTRQVKVDADALVFHNGKCQRDLAEGDHTLSWLAAGDEHQTITVVGKRDDTDAEVISIDEEIPEGETEAADGPIDFTV